MLDNIDWLIIELLKEQNLALHFDLSMGMEDKRKLLRSLMNTRPPWTEADRLLKAQDSELKSQLSVKGSVSIENIENTLLDKKIKLWQGDITRLEVDAIVNAANRDMLGCFYPLHGCIDNAIHSAAGIQLRLECDRLMREQGHPEPTGKAKITKGYNLPAKYVLHTVGPIITKGVSKEDARLLASCYRSCLEIAEENDLKSIAFCCISTGEFHFPNKKAAEIAVDSMLDYFEKNRSTSIETVVFNVFKDLDYNIYKELLK